MAKQPLPREFKHRMLRNAAVLFVSMIAVLGLLVTNLSGKQFALAALIIIPVATLTFNLLMRRAYADHMGGKG